MTEELPPGYQRQVFQTREAQTPFPPPGFIPAPSNVQGIEVFIPGSSTADRLPEVVDFKCPKCGATIAFSVDARMLACEYCGYSQAVLPTQLGRAAEGFEFRVETVARAARGWGEDRKELACQRCGGVVSVPSGTLSYACPFCGSNKVLFREPMEDVLRPRYLIPFQIEPQRCREITRKWLGSSWLTPPELRESAIEKFHPLYIPYWIFAATCNATWKADVAYSKTEVYYENGQRQERETWEWRAESGKVEKTFTHLLVPGTTRLNMSALGQVDNYDVNGLVLYEPSLLAGMQAQAYDLPLDEAWDAGRHIMREQTRKACLDRASGTRVRNFTATVDFRDEAWRYILTPIYTSIYTFGDQTYQILINGQTGRVAGPRPVDWEKVWLVIILLLAPGVLTTIFGMLFSRGQVAGLGLFLLVTGLVFAYFLFNHARETEHV